MQKHLFRRKKPGVLNKYFVIASTCYGNIHACYVSYSNIMNGFHVHPILQYEK